MNSMIEQQTIARIYWRTIPLFFAMMFFNYLDRINIGFAALQMNAELRFSPEVFGFGASIFFFGYMLLEIPSNLIMHRVGARIWLARILLTWGAVATAMAFVWNEWSFYAVRLGLGIMEAGFLPGVALYLTSWFPVRYRARAVGGYIIAGSFSAVLGGPISTVVMTYVDGPLGLHGWQWMFIAEGVPTMLLGLFTLSYLCDQPSDARWLTPEQRSWLEIELRSDAAVLPSHSARAMMDVVKDGRVWALACLFGCALVGIYGLFLWLPQIVKSFGDLSTIEVGFLSAVPPLLGVVGTVIISRSSDRTGDRTRHLAFVYAMSAIAIAGCAYAGNPVLSYLLLCLTGLFIYAGNPLFWSLASSFRTGAAAALAIALINTVAQFGGLIGPWAIGLVRQRTGSFTWALLTIAAFLVIAVVIALLMPVQPPRTEAMREGVARG